MTEKLLLDERFKDIEYNLNVIRERIFNAAIKAGRKSEDITLMAVTKTVDPVFINHAIEYGIDLIGENKVQELLSKEEYLHMDNCKAHLIGHLQTNKVKQIVGKVDMIQSVDSIKLAKEIEKQSLNKNVITNCLIEVNIGNEDSKTGLDLSVLEDTIYQISEMKNIKIRGLMTIPPICEENELNRYFSKMHQIFVDISSKKIDNVSMDILSMGMSSDYETAIINGSTLVRVGTSIFGQRIY